MQIYRNNQLWEDFKYLRCFIWANELDSEDLWWDVADVASHPPATKQTDKKRQPSECGSLWKENLSFCGLFRKFNLAKML